MERGFSKELKRRQGYWLEHLRAATMQGMTLAEYAPVAQVDSDALYRWRALFKRQGVSILESRGGVPVSFTAVRVAAAEAASALGITVHMGAAVQVRCSSWPDPLVGAAVAMSAGGILMRPAAGAGTVSTVVARGIGGWRSIERRTA